MLGSYAASLLYKGGELKNEPFKLTQSGTYKLNGLSPDGFIKQHCGVGEEIDMSYLISNFRKFCYDFEEPTYANIPSFATEFCNKIIFEVGPESKLKNSSEHNTEWRFEFPSKLNPLVKRNVLVCKDKSTYTKSSEDTLVLTVTQASLLSLLTFGRIIELSVRKPEPIYLLTPLAAVIFPKENLPKLLNVIKMLDPEMDMIRQLKIINCSCQPGGQCLPESRADCAAVASIIATRHMKSKTFQHETIRKTLKKYLSIGKIIDQHYFELYGKSASQEIPPELNYSALMKIIKHQ